MSGLPKPTKTTIYHHTKIIVKFFLPKYTNMKYNIIKILRYIYYKEVRLFKPISAKFRNCFRAYFNTKINLISIATKRGTAFEVAPR